MKRLFILAALALVFTGARAQDNEALSFKNARILERALMSGDANQDGILTKAEADSVKIINLIAYRVDLFKISCYDDLAHFPNLKRIHLGYSDLEEVDLSKNPHLEEIVIGDSSLKTLILSTGCNPRLVFPSLMDQLVIKRVYTPGMWW